MRKTIRLTAWRTMLALALALAGLLVMAAPAPAPPLQVGIGGIITDQGSAAVIPSATITLEKRLLSPASVVTSDWASVATTLSGVDGSYKFFVSDMPTDFDYRVTVGADGYLYKEGPAHSYSTYSTITEDHALTTASVVATGTVIDSVTKLPLANMDIKLFDPEWNMYAYVETDAQGRYSIPYDWETMRSVPCTFFVKLYQYGYYHEMSPEFVYDGTTTYNKNFTAVRIPKYVTRVGGANRFEVAANLARKGWDPGGARKWDGVEHVVIANGEAGKEADPLCAAGLAGVYDAPVLLTGAAGLPASTKQVITEIAARRKAEGKRLRVHIIGGIASVPDARWNEIRVIPGVYYAKDRINGIDRYDLSVAIARRMALVKGITNIPGVLIIAGDNPLAFYDALAASPAAYAGHLPMLAVRKDAVPGTVRTALAGSFVGKPRYVVSSGGYISSTVASQVRATERFATTTNRFVASVDITSKIKVKGWGVWLDHVGIASKLPDALAGGAFMGRKNGLLMFTDSSSVMQAAPRNFISSHKWSIYNGWVIGGTLSIPNTQATQFWNLIKY